MSNDPDGMPEPLREEWIRALRDDEMPSPTVEDAVIHVLTRHKVLGEMPDRGRVVTGPLHAGRWIGLAAAALCVLAVGMIWGIGTGVAAVHAEAAGRGDRSLPLAVIRAIPIRNALGALPCVAASREQRAALPSEIPTLDLSATTARTTRSLGAVDAVREGSAGRLLVHDGKLHQLIVFDSTLDSAVVTVQRTADSGRVRPIAFTRYTGDSTLLADPRSRTMRVLDGFGREVRAMALPPGGFRLDAPSYADDRGRVLFASRASNVGRRDSAMVLRVDFVTGLVDTAARLATGASASVVPDRDDWAVLPNGTLAVVRGHDYHVDWRLSDGTARAGGRLAFDWQRLFAERRAAGTTNAAPQTVGVASSNIAIDVAGRVVARLVQFNATTVTGAVLSDLEGNLWVLSTLPSSPDAPLVYDVINAKGELFQRVRVPAGRTIVAFGRGRVVYLLSGNPGRGFVIERTLVPRERT
jgi:hypothetical protein